MATTRRRQAGHKSERLAIDLNRASREELMQIPGIGPSMAEQIIQFRERHGGAQQPIGLDEPTHDSERELDDLVNRLYI